jgi:SAM-dependent methyltransferase
MATSSGQFEGTEMPTAGWWEALWREPAAVLAAIGLAPGLEVVDLCCGDGWFTLPIAKLVRHVVAIDIDPHLLEVARLRLAESGATNCELVQGDAYDVAALVTHTVDFVFLANVFHGVPDKPRLARAVSKILAADGRFAVVNWHWLARERTTILGEPRGPKTELRITPQQTIAAVEPAGLELLRLIELPPYHCAVVFRHAGLHDH